MRHIAVAVIVAVMLAGCRKSPADELNSAARRLEYRPVEGRLSGLPYARRPATGYETRKAQELVFAQQFDELRARALLLAGHQVAAKNLLQKITSRCVADATTWNDYAAALHATATRDDALQLSTALAAADRALDLRPALPEALFNRAIILDALALHADAALACRKYLEVDSSSEWASEIRERLRKIESAQSRIAAWRDVVDDLERAAEAGDELFINDVATTYPEKARRWSDLYLARWGERFLAKDRDGAASMLIDRPMARLSRHSSILADAPRPRRRTNYLEREAHHRRLGLLGEQFVMRFESERLWLAGRKALADRIEHVSDTRGDGEGFDVLSFEEGGRERLIEVKTTTFGEYTPFFVSRYEVEVSSERADQYHVYRLFDFRDDPKLFIVPGDIARSFMLDAIQFEAR